MKVKLKKSKFYRDLFPRPSDVVYGAMREDIRIHGQKTPIYHNKKGIILDGYTKYDIVVVDLKREPLTELKDFKNRKEELDFIMSMNAQRRDLTDGQKYFAFQSYYLEIKILAQKNIARGNNQFTKPKNRVEKFTSQGRFATKIGVSQTQVQRMDYIVKHGDKKDIEDIRKGKKVGSVEKKIRAKFKKIEENEIQTETLELENKLPKRSQKIPCPECGGTGKVWI